MIPLKHRLLLLCPWLLCFLVVGCPPTGDPPKPTFSTDEGDASSAPDGDAGGTRGDAEPLGDCVDHDHDGFVTGVGCGLPTGDCAPHDPQRWPGAREICNLIDDNCDGQSDEGDPGSGERCETGEPGVCRQGTTTCRDGELTCIPLESAGPEICNGLDDDCDGPVDERVPGEGAHCNTGEPGVCSAGAQACAHGELRCDPLATPAAERCNQQDDDCDGEIDEGNPGGGATCETGDQGVCRLGEELCIEGRLVCRAQVGAGVEVCNGLDDDCDGETDEEEIEDQPPCDTGEPGICGPGRQACVDGRLRCVREQQAWDHEICNGQDDDCNGTVDDQWSARLGQPCSAGIGRCREVGALTCDEAGSGVACDAVARDPTTEICNRVDDDCDGEIDEAFEVGLPCEVGEGECHAAGRLACREDGLGVACNAEVPPPSPERCNGLDDDCDGEIDEDFADLGGVCFATVQGCRSEGRWACNDGHNGLTCTAEARAPRPETCNGLDDDCDGEVDESFGDLGQPCGGGVGACHRAGIEVCSADGSGVACSVEPGEPTPEICDGLDNDCDGWIDNGVACVGPALSEVTTWRVADFDDERCPDWDGDGQPDNLLATAALHLNASLAQSLERQIRVLLVRAMGYPPAVDDPQPIRVEFLAGRPTGESVAIDRRSVDEMGFGRTALEPIGVTDGALTMLEPAPVIELVSPFFHDRDPAFAGWATVSLAQATLHGPLGPSEGGALALPEAVLTGALDRASVLTAYEEAQGACEAAGPDGPPGCFVFNEVDAAALAEVLTADLDLDAEEGLDAVSACFLLSAVPAPQASRLAVGGRRCERDDHCSANLVCRALAVIPGAAELGAAMGQRCGLPTEGNGALGEPCELSADCRHGLCVAVGTGEGRCTGLCDDDADCAADLVCRGIALPVPGALTLGGASARICVAAPGSGARCDGPRCPPEEICGLWLAGEVGRPEGSPTLEGRCQTPYPAALADGSRCDPPLGCAHAHGCVSDAVPQQPDRPSDLRCAAPCRETADCGRGAVCLSRNVRLGESGSLDRIAGAAELNTPFCVALPAEVGSGGPCRADADCPGGDVCQPSTLVSELMGAEDLDPVDDPEVRIDGYCVRGEGFYHVGQPCVADPDCGSGRCLEGHCSGRCQVNADCGPHLGCVADSVAIPDTELLFGGQCEPPDIQCADDAQCEAEPLCTRGRCVCDDQTGRCRLGCRAGATECSAGLRCQENGTCEPYCKDDVGEPNETRDDATFIDLGRARTTRTRLHRLCPPSPVDWYRIEPRGQGLFVSARVDSAETRSAVTLELELYDQGGRLLQTGTAVEDTGEHRLWLSAEESSIWFVDAPVWIHVRGSGVIGPTSYTLETALEFPACPDPHDEPNDHIWTWTPLIDTPGINAHQVVSGQICPQDEDWFAIYVGTDDQLTVDFDVLGAGHPAADPEHDQLVLVVAGPGFPGPVSGILGQTDPADGGGHFEMSQFPLYCDRDAQPYANCRHEDLGPTMEACMAETDCAGDTFFLQIRGATPLDRAQYNLEVEVHRSASLACVPDPYEPDVAVDTPLYIVGRGAVDVASVSQTAVLHTVGDWSALSPTIRPGRDMVFRHIRGCDLHDFDHFVMYFPPDTTLSAEIRREGSAALGTALAFVDSLTRERLVDETGYDSELSIGGLRTPPGTYSMRAVQVGYEEAPGGTPYELTIRAEPQGHHPDRGCTDPQPLMFDGEARIHVEGTTQHLYDDHRSLACFGFGGPDRVYRVPLPPRPGRVTAWVEATNGLHDPAISMRTTCAAPESEEACNGDDLTAPVPVERAFVQTELDAREVFIIVDSYSEATSGPYTLQATWESL